MAPRLIWRSNRAWTIEVPVRGGGFAIPVHGVDADGFALDPNNEIAPQREYVRLVDEALARDASWAEIQAIPSPHRIGGV